MIESELAFNKDGEPFSVPETVAAWRAYKMRDGRGAPSLMYGNDGRPLTIAIEEGMDDLREVVDTSCRVRLDPIDADGKAVPNVPSSYVQVTIAPRNASTSDVPIPSNLTSTDHAIRELVRANCELVRANSDLAKAVATQQPDLVRAAAELLRAADGAGMPRRDLISEWDDEAGEDNEPAAAPPGGQDWTSVAHEFLATVKMVAAAAMAKRAAPAGTTAPSAPAATTSAAPSGETARRVDETGESVPAPAPAAVDSTAHLFAIQAQLTAPERTFVMSVVQKLSVEERAEWMEQLANMTVAEAVAMIRTQIEKRKEKAS